MSFPMMETAGLLRVAEARVPLEAARLVRVVMFREIATGLEHLAVLVGMPEKSPSPQVEFHFADFAGDVLGALMPSSEVSLPGVLRRLGEEGTGVLLIFNSAEFSRPHPEQTCLPLAATLLRMLGCERGLRPNATEWIAEHDVL